MYVTNVTVLRGDRGLTDLTPYDILEAVYRVHGQVSPWVIVGIEAGKLANKKHLFSTMINCMPLKGFKLYRSSQRDLVSFG